MARNSMTLEIGPEKAAETSDRRRAAVFIDNDLGDTLKSIDEQIARAEEADNYKDLTLLLHIRRRYELLKRVNAYDL